jgi:hypothetical protein
MFVFTNSAAVVFSSSTNRKYTLYYAGELLTGGWTNLPSQTGISGIGTNTLLDGTITHTQRFYRVGVQSADSEVDQGRRCRHGKVPRPTGRQSRVKLSPFPV